MQAVLRRLTRRSTGNGANISAEAVQVEVHHQKQQLVGGVELGGSAGQERELVELHAENVRLRAEIERLRARLDKFDAKRFSSIGHLGDDDRTISRAPASDNPQQSASGHTLRPGNSSTHLLKRRGIAKVVRATAPFRRRAARVYVCGQQTEALNPQLVGFLRKWSVQQPIKAAMPPFNRRPGMQTLATTIEFNAPVFSPAVANATMALFDTSEMLQLAAELGVRIPRYQLDPFVQKKAVKIKALIAVARERADCATGANAAAVDRLDRFVAEFERLSSAAVPHLPAWHAFVGRHCPAGWEQRLHFDHILSYCFGFEEDTARALRAHQYETTDQKTGASEVTSLEQHSVRWLSKAFGAFGPNGCLGDAVNLALAMLHREPPVELSNETCVDALESLRLKIESAAAGRPEQLASLWLPTHLQQDGESDDTLAWLLLERVRRLLRIREPLRVLAQLGADERLDPIASLMASKGARVFRDPDSRNVEAVLRNFEHLQPSCSLPAAK